MSTTEVALAIQVPLEMRDDLEQIAAEICGDCSVAFNAPEKGKSAPSSFTFDPATGMEVAWIAFKVVGSVAEAVAVGIVAEFILSRLKQRAERAMKTVRIRFPNGEVFNLVVDDPAAMQELRKLLSSSVRK